VSIDVIESGPLRARLAVTRTFVWPERINDKERARAGDREAIVRTELELHAGDDFVRVHTRFDNPSRDHRLRAWFPLPTSATVSRAECAFAIVERGLEAEGGPTERGLPTYPSRRFVSAGGLTIAHEGLLEYELVDGGSALALTLLRATGWLSRVEMAYRPLPAGPPIPLEGPQMIGPVEARYVVHIGDRDPFALVDDAFLPLEVVVADGGGQRGSSGSAFEIDGAEVSALRRVPGGLEIRVFNPGADPTEVTLPGRSGWLVDLRGGPLSSFDGAFALAPWAIATARIPD
jgi:alpha-mannosidase